MGESDLDYGWIENDKGDTVYIFNYDSSFYAGGRSDHRVQIIRTHLEAGKYRLRYKSDEINSYDDWNYPPTHPEFWGIKVIEEDNDIELSKELVEVSVMRVTDLEGDTESGNLYLGTFSGLYKFNYTSKLFERISSGNIKIEPIYTLQKGTSEIIWIGCNKGLAKLNQMTGEIEWVKNFSLPVRVIMEDNDGFIWFYSGRDTWATLGNQLAILNSKSNDLKVLSSSVIFSMYQDRSGIVWIGTGWEGIRKWDRHKWKFKSYKKNPDTKNSLMDDVVWNVYADKEDVLWIGTKSGLTRFDRKNNIFKNYSFDNSEITVVHKDLSGYLWLGTLEKGLIWFNPTDESYKIFSHNPNDSASISGNHVFTLFTDHLGVLWVGTRYDGLNSFNHKTKKFTRYYHDIRNPESISNNSIIHICEDSDKNLWICANKINKYDRINNKFYSIEYYKDAGISTSIYDDKKGNLWVTTFNKGLLLVDKENLLLTRNFSETDGLSSNTISNLIEDSFGTCGSGHSREYRN
jgi:ligand-binding sensor domain-containing protein